MVLKNHPNKEITTAIKYAVAMVLALSGADKRELGRALRACQAQTKAGIRMEGSALDGIFGR